VTHEVPLLFELLYAHFVDPGFRKEAYERSLKLYRQKYTALSSSIDGGMELSGVRFLAGGDNRFGLPDYKNFNKLTLDDVRSWITQSIGNDDVEVSVVGDFDIESTIKLTAKYFGNLSLKPIINEQKEKRLPLFPVGQSKNICFDKNPKRTDRCCLSDGRFMGYQPNTPFICSFGNYFRKAP